MMDPDIFESSDPKIEFAENQIEKSKVLMSTKLKCSICKFGDLRPDGKLTSMIVYGRDGVSILPHQYLRCNYRVGTGERKVECRAGHSHCFATYKGMRIYEDDALKNDVLIVSKQTGFTIDFLLETVGQVDISSGKFEAMAKQYNRFHLRRLPFDVMDRRVEMNPDALNNAYFLFCYIEIGQRYGITNYQIIRNSLDSTILENRGELMNLYRQRWTVDHKCTIPGFPQESQWSEDPHSRLTQF